MSDTAHPKPVRRIAFANQKGGVGKTTSAVNIAACAAEQGRHVVLIDLDPQASATRWLGASTDAGDLLDVFEGSASLADVLTTTVVDGLRVVPASIALTAAEKVLTGQPGAEMVLRSAVDRLLGKDLERVGPIDLVLFDCPPTLGLLAVSALVAAHEVVVPVGIGSMELDGVADLLRTVDLVAQRLNAGLHVSAVVPVAYQGRQRLSQDVVASLTDRFGEDVLQPIRASVRVREAPSAQEPLTLYAPTEPVTDDFRAVTTALLQRGATP